MTQSYRDCPERNVSQLPQYKVLVLRFFSLFGAFMLDGGLLSGLISAGEGVLFLLTAAAAALVMQRYRYPKAAERRSTFTGRELSKTMANGNTNLAFSRGKILSLKNEKRMLRKQTRKALQNGEFKMFLQFVVRAEDGEVSGAEALSRWEHPRRGLLYPESYIDLMEAENTIQELDFYIFEESCRQLEAWEKEGEKICISCNFTRSTIELENFISRLRGIAEQYSFDHAHLIMEITEDMAEKNRKTVFENITTCKELGFRIALDDIGSGYTSFSDLRDYPIDIVKIDKSILNAAVDPNGVAFLDDLVTMAHSLHVKVLCEGVEIDQQTEFLCRLGCDYMQGYYFFRPLPKEEAERVLQGTRGRAFM